MGGSGATNGVLLSGWFRCRRNYRLPFKLQPLITLQHEKLLPLFRKRFSCLEYCYADAFLKVFWSGRCVCPLCLHVCAERCISFHFRSAVVEHWPSNCSARLGHCTTCCIIFKSSQTQSLLGQAYRRDDKWSSGNKRGVAYVQLPGRRAH
jgi:hypothetical protein